VTPVDLTCDRLLGGPAIHRIPGGQIEVNNVGARFAGRLAYHSSCHLSRDLGVKLQPGLLLNNIKEAEIVELPHSEECCGFGGLFSIEHPEISRAMLDRKIHNIHASGAGIVVACDAGCVTHINGGLHRRGLSPCARHIAEVLEKT
jgi:L-lactate dehydrogenase complex protein LldE